VVDPPVGGHLSSLGVDPVAPYEVDQDHNRTVFQQGLGVQTGAADPANTR
jgi:hypothetical protein